MSKKQLISCVFVLFHVFLAGNASSETEQVYAGWAVGDAWDGYGTILRSTDSGRTWIRQGEGQIPDVKMSGVFALDPSTAWVVGFPDSGYATIYNTTDGGNTWVRKGPLADHPDFELRKVHASGGGVWAVGPNAILYSDDDGDSWTNQFPLELGLEDVNLQGVNSVDGTTVWVTGGPDAQDQAVILKSTDAGLTWTRQMGGDVADTEYMLGISAADADTAWAVGRPYAVLKTTDGGKHWIRDTYFSEDHSFQYDINEVYAVDPSNAWVASDFMIYWTTDGGQSWEKGDNHGLAACGSLAFMGVSAVTAQEAWGSHAFYGGCIANTNDGGTTWTRFDTLGDEDLPGLWNISFAVQPINPERLTLTVGPGRRYGTIQGAVDAAREGDTILVYPGYYEESVLVTTNHLEIATAGEGVAVYSPHGGTAAFTVFADRVTVRGFGELTGIPDCVPGIEFQGSANTFADNVINPGSCPGVNALVCRDPDGGSNYNLIENNTIVHADLGIVITSESTDFLNIGNTIRNNIINNITQTGIAVQNGTGFTISGNIIPESVTGNCISVIGDNNMVQGFHQITDNQITYCSEYGIAFWADHQTRLVHNQISRNEVSFSSHGINLYADPGAMVGRNQIYSNTVFRNQLGIVLNEGGDHNILFKNDVVTQIGDGIQVNGDWNWIFGNTAIGNGPYDLNDRGTNNLWWSNDYETASWDSSSSVPHH